MDWKQFFASAISSLTWPIAAVIIACLFRRSFAGLISRAQTIKYGSLVADFGKTVEDVERQVAALDANSTTQPVPANLPPVKIVEIASVSPREAILEAWAGLEAEIDRALERRQLFIAHNEESFTIVKMEALQAFGCIDEPTFRTFKELYQLRNQAAHFQPNITEHDAITMARLCEWVIHRLKAI